jgi:hypothetical protein
MGPAFFPSIVQQWPVHTDGDKMTLFSMESKDTLDSFDWDEYQPSQLLQLAQFAALGSLSYAVVDINTPRTNRPPMRLQHKKIVKSGAGIAYPTKETIPRIIILSWT